MIQEIKGFELVCDGCGDSYENGDGSIQVFTSLEELSEMAFDEWSEAAHGTHYCENCQKKKTAAQGSGQNSTATPAQQTPHAICPHFGTLPISDEDNGGVVFNMPTCRVSGKLA